MDTSVALVEAYLHINGYFTVTEYPIVEAMGHGGYRAATDLDILAVRFPAARRSISNQHGRKMEIVFHPDPVLCDDERVVDLIIAEVKEGRAELNRGAREPAVLKAAFERFGCCPPEVVDQSVEHLIQHGEVVHSSGHRLRLVAFGTSTKEPLGYPCTTISLRHVREFTEDYIRAHWDVLSQAQFKQPAMGMQMLLEKIRRVAE